MHCSLDRVAHAQPMQRRAVEAVSAVVLYAQGPSGALSASVLWTTSALFAESFIAQHWPPLITTYNIDCIPIPTVLHCIDFITSFALHIYGSVEDMLHESTC